METSLSKKLCSVTILKPRLLLLWNTSIYIKTTIEVRLECTGWRFAWRTSCSNVLESELVGVVYIFVRWFLLDCNRSLQEIHNIPHIERVLLSKRHNGSGKKLKEPADDRFNVLGETVHIWKDTGGLGQTKELGDFDCGRSKVCRSHYKKNFR